MTPDATPMTLHPQAAIPVWIVTGFLGSGKTTLIRRLLEPGDLIDTGVVLNELGDTGLDHKLVEIAQEDALPVPAGLHGGAAGSDADAAMRTLLERRERRGLPAYARVIFETSGIADPTPMLESFLADAVPPRRFALMGLVAVVDAVLGASTLAEFEEARVQVASADRVLLTKVDLASDSQASDTMAALRACTSAPIEPAGADADAELAQQMLGLVGPGPSPGGAVRTRSHAAANAGSALRAQSFRIPGYFRRRDLERWLEVVTERHGAALLRLKGLVKLRDYQAWVGLHAERQLWHWPEPVEGVAPDLPEDGLVVAVARAEAAASVAESVGELARLAATAGDGGTTSDAEPR